MALKVDLGLYAM